MLIGICIGLFFGITGGFVLFALLSTAKEYDLSVEELHFEGESTDNQPECEESIKQQARQEFLDELRTMTYEEIVTLIENG